MNNNFDIKNKPNAGFSYIEIILSLALFLLLAAVAVPSINQAVRNMEFTQSRHGAHLAANSIMLAVRDAGVDEQHFAAFQAAARHDVDSFRVWIIGDNSREIFSPNAPDAYVNAVAGVSGSIVVAVVFDENGIVAGQAVGMAMNLPWLILAFFCKPPTKKAKSGGAYIMVLIITMAIISALVLTLSVTMRSRDTSARQGDFGSFYNLAVAGSEHALEILNRGAMHGLSLVPEGYEFTQDELIHLIRPYVMEEIHLHFTPELQWYFTFELNAQQDFYRITTEIHPMTNHFRVDTTVHIFLESEFCEIFQLDGWSFPVRTTAQIIWQDIRICLDENPLTMVELKRVDRFVSEDD